MLIAYKLQTLLSIIYSWYYTIDYALSYASYIAKQGSKLFEHQRNKYSPLPNGISHSIKDFVTSVILCSYKYVQYVIA